MNLVSISLDIPKFSDFTLIIIAQLFFIALFGFGFWKYHKNNNALKLINEEQNKKISELEKSLGSYQTSYKMLNEQLNSQIYKNELLVQLLFNQNLEKKENEE